MVGVSPEGINNIHAGVEKPKSSTINVYSLGENVGSKRKTHWKQWLQVQACTYIYICMYVHVNVH